jgi:hypothetical protein
MNERLIVLTAAFWIAIPAAAQDAQLNALHATMASLHELAAQQNNPEFPEAGAAPKLRLAKHQLRD